MPTAKQARFIAEYLVDLNGCEAAVRAGYSPSSARHTASRLLQKPHIKAEVQRLKAEQLDKAGITAERVLEQLRRIAFFDPAVVFDDGGSLNHPKDWPGHARPALASMDVSRRTSPTADGTVDRVTKIRFEPKLQALEMLAKHLGLLVDRGQVDNNITITWLPPEPAPPEAEVETIDAMGPPRAPTRWTPPIPDPQEKMGFEPDAPRPSDRTHVPSFSESYGAASSSVHSISSDEDIDRSAEFTGISRKAQERMFPELRKPKIRL